MASVALQVAPERSDDRFFFGMAVAMGLTTVAGFATHFAMGRSALSVPAIFHIHGMVFMTWVALFLAQSWLGTRGPIALHRRLGWIGAGWALLLVIMGPALTIYVVREGTAPFFFRPQHFLIANPLTVMAFAGLTAAAIRLRRQSDWHKRLHMCGMASILGPGFGRLLPMPFMGPYAFEIAAGAGLIFPIAGIIRDRRRNGRAHPAWWWGIGAIVSALLLAAPLSRSAFGDWLYATVTAGTPGATVAPLEFAPPPVGPATTS